MLTISFPFSLSTFLFLSFIPSLSFFFSPPFFLLFLSSLSFSVFFFMSLFSFVFLSFSLSFIFLAHFLFFSSLPVFSLFLIFHLLPLLSLILFRSSFLISLLNAVHRSSFLISLPSFSPYQSQVYSPHNLCLLLPPSVVSSGSLACLDSPPFLPLAPLHSFHLPSLSPLLFHHPLSPFHPLTLLSRLSFSPPILFSCSLLHWSLFSFNPFIIFFGLPLSLFFTFLLPKVSYMPPSFLPTSLSDGSSFLAWLPARTKRITPLKVQLMHL